MKTPALAIPELGVRLSNWIAVSDGVALIVGEGDRLHALPARNPWYVTCGSDGIEVTITHWASSDDPIMTHLTRASLTKEECRPLVLAVGKQLLGLFGKF